MRARASPLALAALNFAGFTAPTKKDGGGNTCDSVFGEIFGNHFGWDLIHVRVTKCALFRGCDALGERGIVVGGMAAFLGSNERRLGCIGGSGFSVGNSFHRVEDVLAHFFFVRAHCEL